MSKRVYVVDNRNINPSLYNYTQSSQYNFMQSTTTTTNTQNFYTSNNYQYTTPININNNYVVDQAKAKNINQKINYQTIQISQQNPKTITYVSKNNIIPQITYVDQGINKIINQPYYITSPVTTTTTQPQTPIYTNNLNNTQKTAKNVSIPQYQQTDKSANYIDSFKDYFKTEEKYGSTCNYNELTYDPKYVKKQSDQYLIEYEERLTNSLREKDSQGNIITQHQPQLQTQAQSSRQQNEINQNKLLDVKEMMTS